MLEELRAPSVLDVKIAISKLQRKQSAQFLLLSVHSLR